ncbi:MerR family transcriptional regulator [Kordiimonas sp.]|uniref:MerR family transcriptional regulator n=1 Tax=Kordiimonas sp. TaxID=1970157 RepID=UPI003A94E57E
MNIGEVAAKCGLRPKTIRYYESRGFVQPVRSGNGYRNYSAQDLQQLRFLAQMRRLGLPLSECRKLLFKTKTDAPDAKTISQLFREHLKNVTRDIQILEDKKNAITIFLEKVEADRAENKKHIDLV